MIRKDEYKFPEKTFFSFYGTGEDSETSADGSRLNLSQLETGNFEWWYTDGHLSDGSVFVASYHYEVKENNELYPYMTFNLSKNEETICDLKIPVSAGECSFSQDECDCRLGTSYLKTLDGLNKYEIFVDPAMNNGTGLKLVLDKTVPTFSPGPKTLHDNASKFIGWLCTVPNGTIEGTVTIHGEETQVTGVGYHDHNWGDCDMSVIVDDWIWSRGDVGGYTTVAYSVNRKDGSIGGGLFIAKGAEILIAVNSPQVHALEGDKKPNPKTGKPTSTDCIFFYETPQERASVRFNGKNTIALFPYGEDDKNVWWYTRYDAQTTIDMTLNGSRTEVVGNATFEVMDFNGETKDK